MSSSIATTLVVVAGVLAVVGSVVAAWFKGAPTAGVLLGTFAAVSAGVLLGGSLMLPLVTS